jgi:anti-sigma B factor antagonist
MLGMSFARRVTVKDLPEELTLETADGFFNEVESSLESKRPLVVFDCSDVRYFDSAGLATLLRCLEEVLKRNGDLKLAAVSAANLEILEVTGVDRLFEIFDNPKEAVDSFHRIPAYDYQDAMAAYTQNAAIAGSEMTA